MTVWWAEMWIGGSGDFSANARVRAILDFVVFIVQSRCGETMTASPLLNEPAYDVVWPLGHVLPRELVDPEAQIL